MIKKNVAGIIVKNKKIILQLRDNKKDIIFPNSWGFFYEAAEVTLMKKIFFLTKRFL